MTGIIRRVTITAGATVGGLALLTGTASAHFCYLVNASDKSNAGRAGSAAWTSFGELAAAETGVCPEGAAVFAEALGITTSTPIFDVSTLANGTLRNGKEKDVPAVGYLDFDVLGATFEAAFEACEPQP